MDTARANGKAGGLGQSPQSLGKARGLGQYPAIPTAKAGSNGSEPSYGSGLGQGSRTIPGQQTFLPTRSGHLRVLGGLTLATWPAWRDNPRNHASGKPQVTRGLGQSLTTRPKEHTPEGTKQFTPTPNPLLDMRRAIRLREGATLQLTTPGAKSN